VCVIYLITFSIAILINPTKIRICAILTGGLMLAISLALIITSIVIPITSNGEVSPSNILYFLNLGVITISVI
jgi:hypothetical protein